MSLILIFGILVLTGFTLYFGKRFKTWFNLSFNQITNYVYWLAIFVSMFSLPISLLAQSYSHYWLPLIGDYLFAFVICAVYIMLIFDGLHLLLRCYFPINNWTRIAYLLSTFLLFGFGYLMAKDPIIRYYQVNINKSANVNQLRIVQASDLHINELTPKAFIQQLITKINQLKPDLIVLTGDIIDRRLSPFIDHGFDKQLTQLQAKYGVFVVVGNHEYYGLSEENKTIDDVINAYQSAKMKVLGDDVVYNAQLGLTLIGRYDYSAYLHGLPRAKLADLVLFSDTQKPIILLDHQPKDLIEPQTLGIDLMISGHTHAGQVFPINLVVALMYKNAHGQYYDDNHHFTSIVSSGYGLWGPPLRLMTQSEIVVIDVNFIGPK